MTQTPESKHSKSGKGKLGWKELLLSLFLIIVVWAGQQFFNVDLSSIGTGSDSGGGSDPALAHIEVFFTTPRYPDTASYHYGGLDEKLAAVIDAAETSVDVAVYDLNLARVADALVRAHQRGVRVRVVTDEAYEDELGPQRLRKAKVPLVMDERDPYMHDKFVVIDGRQVWTGSWNLTDNGTYRNNNNVVVVESKALAKNYTTEFEEMFVDHKFGSTSPDVIPNPEINLDGAQLETIFESEGNARARIVALIEDAKSSVNFMAFVFTDDDIARAIVAQHRAGINVRGVVEDRNTTSTGSNYRSMRRAGVAVLTDGNPYIMHHKVIIIDKAIVITGSYNFTNSAANYNDENVLIIHSPEVATLFMDEFERVYKQAQQ